MDTSPNYWQNHYIRATLGCLFEYVRWLPFGEKAERDGSSTRGYQPLPGDAGVTARLSPMETSSKATGGFAFRFRKGRQDPGPFDRQARSRPDAGKLTPRRMTPGFKTGSRPPATVQADRLYREVEP